MARRRVVQTLPAVSLFTGAGGLDLGLTTASRGSIDFRAWVEVDRDAHRTLLTNRVADPARLFVYITALSPDELPRAARLTNGELLPLPCGPPRQAFRA